jgi:serine/threonine protein kinase
MEYLHSKQLVVRDLRTSAVLVGEDGTVKLSHFGVMRALLGYAESEPPEDGRVRHSFKIHQARRNECNSTSLFPL